VAERREKLAGGKLGKPEHSLPLAAEPTADPSDLVIAKWGDGCAWQVPALTVRSLHLEASASRQVDGAWKGEIARLHHGEHVWRLQEVNQRNTTMLFIKADLGEGYAQKLQLVVKDFTDEQRRCADSGMKEIMRRMAEEGMSKDDAEKEKLKYVVRRAKAAAKKRPASVDDETPASGGAPTGAAEAPSQGGEQGAASAGGKLLVDAAGAGGEIKPAAAAPAQDKGVEAATPTPAPVVAAAGSEPSASVSAQEAPVVSAASSASGHGVGAGAASNDLGFDSM
ncbi:unnamed protein product, partial [Prorocentrum cordatum]